MDRLSIFYIYPIILSLIKIDNRNLAISPRGLLVDTLISILIL